MDHVTVLTKHLLDCKRNISWFFYSQKRSKCDLVKVRVTKQLPLPNSPWAFTPNGQYDPKMFSTKAAFYISHTKALGDHWMKENDRIRWVRGSSLLDFTSRMISMQSKLVLSGECVHGPRAGFRSNSTTKLMFCLLSRRE